MEDVLKRFIYTGVGLLSLTTTRIKETISELVSNRKITQEEGRKIMEDFAEMAKNHTDDFEEQIQSMSSRYGMDFAFSPESEIAMLKERVAALESRLENDRPEIASSQALKNKPANERKRIIFQNRQQKKQETGRTDRSPAEKVANNERVSLGDEILTPEKKMEAEKFRTQNQTDRPSQRRAEKDTQKASLGNKVLTPEKKVEQDSKDARDKK